jgi:hypothetical protein
VASNPSAVKPRLRPCRRARAASFLASAGLFLVLLCSTFAIHAELVVFSTGEVLKVSAANVSGQDVLLQLKSGGRMRLPLLRIERILDDEIEEPAPPAPAVTLPVFELGFLDSHPVPAAPYGLLIHDMARRYRVNPGLVAAIVRCESAFDATATSPRGAQGLLQLMPATAERFGVDPVELHDPVRNLDAGVRYLRWLADRFDNDLPKVLAAFNSGEGTVDRFRGVPPYRETRDYVRRVYLELGLSSAL